MNRKCFLKSLLALGATTMLPTDNILKATDYIEKKAEPEGLLLDQPNLPNKFVNHMTIQRKTYTITGGPQTIVWHEVRGEGNYYNGEAK